MPAAERPGLDPVQDDEFWRPHLDSEMRALWLEFKKSDPDLVELIEDCFGQDPWRAVTEEIRTLVFVLAFQHQADDPQWAVWLDFLVQSLRARRRRMCASTLAPDRAVKRP